MKHLAGLTLTPEQHRQLVDICDSPLTFPPTYEGWLNLVRTGEAEAAHAGEVLRPVEIDVDEFVSWCRMVGVVPCIDALKAYAIVQRIGTTESAFITVAPAKRNGNGRSA